MNSSSFRLSATIVVMSIVALSLNAQEPFRSHGGVSSLWFNQNLLTDLGIVLSISGGTPGVREGAWDFGIQEGTGVLFDAPGGNFEGLEDGTLVHQGGFKLRLEHSELSLEKFWLKTLWQDPINFELTDSEGNRWFLLRHAHSHLDLKKDRLALRHMDLVFSPELARWIGRPDLSNVFVGSVSITLPLYVPNDTRWEGCTTDFEGDVDVVLTFLGPPSQYAREAGVRVALSSSASLRNEGTADVPWYRAIEPDGTVGQHPFLVQHFYMVRDGRIVSLGRSDVKHAFFSINSGCACPGGQILYVGCGDTYGASTNVDRFYLGPRDELAAFKGIWESLGSHFDADPVDDYRDHGREGHDSFDHLLVVPESELGHADATYFIEAWYLVKDDINIFNSMGHLQVEPTLNGSAWSFIARSALSPGPAIDSWVAPDSQSDRQASTRIDTESGRLALGVNVIDDGDGFRYEYAVMNLDYDKKIAAIDIPFLEDTHVENLVFGDMDLEPSNDWQATVTTGGVRWVAPQGNELPWGTLFYFSFETESAPTQGDVSIYPETSLGDPHFSGTLLVPQGPCTSLAELIDRVVLWRSETTLLELVGMVTDLCDTQLNQIRARGVSGYRIPL